MSKYQTQTDALFRKLIIEQPEVAELTRTPLFLEVEKELHNWNWRDFPKRMRYNAGYGSCQIILFLDENDELVARIIYRDDKFEEKMYRERPKRK